MRLLAVCAKEDEGTAYYRGTVPLAVLQRHHSKLHVENGGASFEWNANGLRFSDMVFFQRPHSPDHLAFLQCVSDLGIPIWIDQDDYVLNLPEGHPSKACWDDSTAQNTFTQILGLADTLTVSTPALADEYRKYVKAGAKVVVIPNAFDDELLLKKKISPPRRAPVPTVLWRGSPIHDPDLLGLENSLPDIAEEFPQWKWIFLGHKPFFLTARMPQSSWNYVGWKDGVHNYLSTLNRIQPKIVIVPLADNTFNRCKSNIAWIEGTFANAMVIAPSYLPEWERPGVIHYNSLVDFPVVLEQAMRGKWDIDKCCDESWKYVIGHLKLTEVNKLRAEILGV